MTEKKLKKLYEEYIATINEEPFSFDILWNWFVSILVKEKVNKQK